MEALETGRERMLSDPRFKTLLSCLRRQLQSITRNLYVFSWIQEQTADIYHILVDGAIVVHIEMPRVAQDHATAFEKWSVAEYMKGRTNLAKRTRRKLELALQLALARGAG